MPRMLPSHRACAELLSSRLTTCGQQARSSSGSPISASPYPSHVRGHLGCRKVVQTHRRNGPMSERAGLQRRRCLGLVSSLLCILAGCGGNNGSSDMHAPASRVGQLSLQLVVSPRHVNTSSHAGPTSAQSRQVKPDDIGFIERLEVRLQAQDSDLVPLQSFMLNAAEQETVTREVSVPDTVPMTFQVLISSFNSQGLELFRGSTPITRGQDSAVVSLV